MAVTVTLQAIADTWIGENAPSQNNGSNATLGLSNVTNLRKRILLKWDLSSIPSGATFPTTPKLRLHGPQSANGVANTTVRAYGMSRDWSETEATWNIYSTGNAWGTAGAWGEADKTSSVVGSMVVDYTLLDVWYEMEIEAADRAELASWHGLLLANDTDGEWGACQFFAREHPGYIDPYRAPMIPELVVNYTTGSTASSARIFLPVGLTAKGGTFAAALTRKLDIFARNLRTRLGQAGDAANLRPFLTRSDGVAAAAWHKPVEVDPTNARGLYHLPLTEAEAAAGRISLAGESDTRNVQIDPLLNQPGPDYVAEVEADVVSIAGSSAAATALARDACSILRGAVFVDGTYTATTTIFYTTLPARADGYAGMVLRFDDGDHSGVWRTIASSETVSTYTKVTLATALSSAPATGTLVSAGGNKE